MADNKANVAWRELFQKYGIPETVKAQGQFPITADQIKEFREPRLMAKWDSSEDLPQILRSSGLSLSYFRLPALSAVSKDACR